MPTYRFGDLWSAWNVDREDGVVTDLVLITTNSTLRVNGQLIMGAGVAAEAVKRFSVHSLPSVLGKQIAEKCLPVRERVGGVIYSDYNLIVSPRWEEGKGKLGILQTKRWPFDDSPLDLVVASIEALSAWLFHASVKIGRDPIVHMVYPGVGYGKLSIAQLRPYIETLPDNVYIWRPESAKPLPLPKSHDLHNIITMSEADFSSQFMQDMSVIYHSVDDEPNGRLLQYLTLLAYKEALESGLRKPETAARHIANNKFAQLKREYANP